MCCQCRSNPQPHNERSFGHHVTFQNAVEHMPSPTAKLHMGSTTPLSRRDGQVSHAFEIRPDGCVSYPPVIKPIYGAPDGDNADRFQKS